MKFYFGEPTARFDAVAQEQIRTKFADVVFGCQACGNRDETREHDTLVPAGTMHNIECGACGHIGVGLPPR